MRFLPVGLDMRDRACVIVGGGSVGTRKAVVLLRAGASVSVISPAVTIELAREIERGRVRWLQERFRPEHLDHAFLAVLATDDVELNAAATRLATERGVLACDASSAHRSRFIFGALLERDELTIATFTDGRDPRLARAARDKIRALLRERGGGRTGGGGKDRLLVLAAHGSRSDHWGVPLEALTASLQAELRGCVVRLAYTQFASPTVPEVVTEAVRSGVRTIRVLPLFMTGNGHVDRDIRPMITDLRATHPDIDLALLPPVGEHAPFRRALLDIARETMP